MEKETMVGMCGIACGACTEYKAERCKGCGPKVPEDICPLPKCAKEKGVKFCFDCSEFPCEKNYKKGPIASALLDYWKKNRT